MTRITFFLPLPAAELLLFNSALFLFHSGYLSLPVLLALCLQPLMCSLGKWLMGLHGVQCVSTGPPSVHMQLCVYARLCEWVCVPQCEHCNVTGLCNWNGNEPISNCSGVPPFAAFTSLFCQTHPFCLTLCTVWKCSGSNLPLNPRVWRGGNKDVVPKSDWHMCPRSVSTWFSRLCVVVTHSLLGQLWHNKDL